MPVSMAGPVWRAVTATVAVLAALAFLNALGGEFVLDDRPFLVDNPKLDQLHSVAWFFRENLWFYSNLDGAFSSSYRPLFFLTLWSLNSIGAGGPLALHCFALLLHVLATVLLLRLIRRLMPEASAVAAGFGAALFAVHPVHSEAVAWVAAFPHALSTVFLLCSCLYYLNSHGAGVRRNCAFAVAFFCLALLSNEVAAAFPLFLLAYEWLNGRPARLRRSLPFFAVLVLYAAQRHAVLGQPLPLDLLDADAWFRLPVFIAGYLGQLVVPWPQPLFLDMPESWRISAGAWLGMALLAAMVVVAIRTSRRLALPAIAWVAAFLVPPLAAAFNPDALFALRSLYAASIGLSLLVVAVAGPLHAARPTVAAVLAGMFLLGCLVLTAHANRPWANDGLVYARIIDWNPRAYAGYAGLGVYFERQGALQAAVGQYRAALERAGPADKPTAMENLGRAQSLAGNYPASLRTFDDMLRAYPANALAWIGIGNNRWSLGELQGAAEAYRQAHGLDPTAVVACQNLRLVLLELGRVQEASRYSDCAAGRPPQSN
jgi:tetratricopeptide (TPR) repeat protein